MSNLTFIFKKNGAGWTDLNQSPEKVFTAACEFIAQRFDKHGFEFLKSKRQIRKASRSGDLHYIIEFGTSRRNHRGESVEMNIIIRIESKRIEEFRNNQFEKCKERMLCVSDNLVTQTGFGYLTDSDSFLDGMWNLIGTHPERIVKQLENYALPCFERYEDLPGLTDLVSKHGNYKEFSTEFRTLDFLMCFGGYETAKKGLIEMLTKRNWTNNFRSLYSDLENGKKMKDHRAFLLLLVERAYIYGIKI
jgi:hypothetical protein